MTDQCCKKTRNVYVVFGVEGYRVMTQMRFPDCNTEVIYFGPSYIMGENSGYVSAKCVFSSNVGVSEALKLREFRSAKEVLPGFPPEAVAKLQAAFGDDSRIVIYHESKGPYNALLRQLLSMLPDGQKYVIVEHMLPLGVKSYTKAERYAEAQTTALDYGRPTVAFSNEGLANLYRAGWPKASKLCYKLEDGCGCEDKCEDLNSFQRQVKEFFSCTSHRFLGCPLPKDRHSLAGVLPPFCDGNVPTSRSPPVVKFVMEVLTFLGVDITFTLPVWTVPQSSVPETCVEKVYDRCARGCDGFKGYSGKACACTCDESHVVGVKVHPCDPTPSGPVPGPTPIDMVNIIAEILKHLVNQCERNEPFEFRPYEGVLSQLEYTPRGGKPVESLGLFKRASAKDSKIQPYLQSAFVDRLDQELPWDKCCPVRFVSFASWAEYETTRLPELQHGDVDVLKDAFPAQNTMRVARKLKLEQQMEGFRVEDEQVLAFEKQVVSFEIPVPVPPPAHSVSRPRVVSHSPPSAQVVKRVSEAPSSPAPRRQRSPSPVDHAAEIRRLKNQLEAVLKSSGPDSDSQDQVEVAADSDHEGAEHKRRDDMVNDDEDDTKVVTKGDDSVVPAAEPQPELPIPLAKW